MDVPLKLAVSAKKDFKLGNVTAEDLAGQVYRAEDTQWLDLAGKESEDANLPCVLPDNIVCLTCVCLPTHHIYFNIYNYSYGRYLYSFAV